MNFTEYDDACADLDRGSPIPEASLAYYTLALGGESGEVQNEVKKVFRDDDGIVTPARHDNIVLELGDMLWYMSRVARMIGTDLQTVAQMNVDKLRKARAAKQAMANSGVC